MLNFAHDRHVRLYDRYLFICKLYDSTRSASELHSLLVRNKSTSRTRHSLLSYIHVRESREEGGVRTILLIIMIIFCMPSPVDHASPKKEWKPWGRFGRERHFTRRAPLEQRYTTVSYCTVVVLLVGTTQLYQGTTRNNYHPLNVNRVKTMRELLYTYCSSGWCIQKYDGCFVLRGSGPTHCTHPMPVPCPWPPGIIR